MHQITALILAGPFDADAARRFDLVAVPLAAGGLTMFHVDRDYARHWQAVLGYTELIDLGDEFPDEFPRERALVTIACALTGVRSRRSR